MRSKTWVFNSFPFCFPCLLVNVTEQKWIILSQVAVSVAHKTKRAKVSLRLSIYWIVISNVKHFICRSGTYFHPCNDLFSLINYFCWRPTPRFARKKGKKKFYLCLWKPDPQFPVWNCGRWRTVTKWKKCIWMFKVGLLHRFMYI